MKMKWSKKIAAEHMAALIDPLEEMVGTKQPNVVQKTTDSIKQMLSRKREQPQL